MGENIYAAPSANLQSFNDEGGFEQLRKKYIQHEASVKSIGGLYLIGAFFCVIAGLMSVFSGDGAELITSLMILVFAFLYGWLGISVRKLKPGSKIPVGILSGIGLLGFPIGTIINAYILYLVFSAKGKMVFSDEYQEAIAATPHVKHKTSIILKVFLLLLLLVFAFAIFATFKR